MALTIKTMVEEISKTGSSIFEKIRQLDANGNEYWGARQLAKVLDYSDFRNFLTVITKAREACENSGHPLGNHLVDFTEMVSIGSGAKREMESVKLSRYACYLIVQNADPSKEVVALGQTYFAVQTRLQEIRQMDEYNRLSTEDEKRIFLDSTGQLIQASVRSISMKEKQENYYGNMKRLYPEVSVVIQIKLLML